MHCDSVQKSQLQPAEQLGGLCGLSVLHNLTGGAGICPELDWMHRTLGWAPMSDLMIGWLLSWLAVPGAGLNFFVVVI